ncbi:MAG: hypothetical protein GWN94_24850 [Phycisphaerae bacterium]|nr:hypothetical protein [Phycisphaerae bacterium]NIP56325.1 hypothetical protein [Phycisphaerae bacterium]NIS54283.1 hypothetical protein [Phycisphaerae bacterium]NIX29848.1 hypothetical protein [Phycisphaerae bacterium]
MGKLRTHFRKRIVAKKAGEPLTIGILVALVLKYFAPDLELEPEAVAAATGGITAIWRAFRNWRKNRRR